MKRRGAGRRTALGAAALCAAAAAGAVAAADLAGLRFHEVGEQAGARFVHSTRDFGDRLKADVLEMFTDGGAAVAVGDFDGDGWDDLFLTDSGEGRPQHLLRNLTGERGELAFEDVAAAAGVAGGNTADAIVADALWLDYDGDGRRDLLVVRFGTPILYRNLGPDAASQVKFADVTAAAGLAGAFDNSLAAIAFDADGDGWLDLLLGHYFPPLNLLRLETPHVLPNDLDDADNGGGLSLWRNVERSSDTGSGGRGFVEVTAEAGLGAFTGWTLDLGHGDLDGDGDQDLYVAGDYGTDRLFTNDGDGTFTDATEAAVGRDTRKGMNAEIADYDRDGRLDVFVTNITDEYMRECNMLWHNEGDGTFVDLSRETGTCDSDWGWGGKFADLDNDGWLDLFTVNGLRSAGEENYIPLLLEALISPDMEFSNLHAYPDIGDRTWSGYQRQRLFRNLGDGTFADVALSAGVGNDLDGRGVAVADLDRDGRLDLVQTNARGPSLLYRNASTGTGRWVALRLAGGAGSNGDAVGARVTVTAGGAAWVQEVDGGNGYAAQSSLVRHFGLGGAERVEAVEVRWPSGRVERLTAAEGVSAVPLDRLTELREGEVGGGGAADEDPAAADRDAELARLRNLGKAMYENPATQYEAVEVLRRALALAPESARERLNLGLALLRAGREEEGIAELEAAQRQDPALPHTWFNLGIAYKRAARYADAAAQLERMVELVPDEPITRYNLGVLYKLQGDAARSRAAFERAAALDPYLAGARFQLATAYRQAGDNGAAARAMAEFRELKALQADDAVTEDLEWSFYAELHDPLAPHAAAAEPNAEPVFEVREVADGVGAGGEVTVLDADGDEWPDLLVTSVDEVRLYLDPGRTPRREDEGAGGDRAPQATEEGVGGAEGEAPTATDDPPPFAEPLTSATTSPSATTSKDRPAQESERTRTSSQQVIEGEGILAAVPGDFDDDGLPDLAVVAAGGVTLWRNAGGGFVPHGVAPPAAAGRGYRGAVWLDHDHDYDVDLLLLGETSALLRNVGEGAFAENTEAFPFVAGTALDAVQLDLVPDTPGLDLAVSYADRAGVVYRDLLGGRYEAVELPQLPAGAHRLAAVDLDGDGWTDLAAAGPDGPLLLRNLPDAGFAAVELPAGLPAGAPPLLVDVENRGSGELVAGERLARNQGGGRFGAPAALAAGPGGPLIAHAAADFDDDGRTDLAALDGDGGLRLLLNRTASAHHWLRVGLTGVKNLKLAPGAEVEVKAAGSYQKRLWQGVPLVFGLGPHAGADTVRITWPNGLIQNELRQEADRAVRYEEAQRLSGSCPMVFAWNGRGMGFVSDVLGVAPLGAAAGDGVYFQVDHNEYLAISGEQLVPREGLYDVRLTEELREVGYLDQVKLLAVDHPAEVDVFHSDKFKGPPYPDFELYAVGARRHPVAARDHRGRDVLPALLATDGTYPDGFRRDYAGLAERHFVELDFGAGRPGGEDGVLVLHGWVDWADGSTFKATSQSDAGPKVELPSLQVLDANGRWQTAIADMGVPAGKPKTIVVEMAGRWLSASRRVRIATSLAAYWDEAFLAAPLALEPRLHEVPPLGAELRFRGFSRVEVHPQRLQPEWFVYEDVRTTSMWDPTPGLYTRYGEVAELLASIDDRFVVFGAGDEVALRFDAAALPPLPPGWRRDFLLFVDGWAKDGDHNTAFARSVEPLPHHGMPEYPYGADHPFPDGAEHRAWREEYQTRPALRLLRPLRPVGVAGVAGP